VREIDGMTEKLHVLAVLEDGSFKNARQVRISLKVDFNLKPSLDAVRKHLQRCSKQGLVTSRKPGRSRQYRISVKGRERLRRIRAERKKEAEQSRSKLVESSELERPSDEQRKLVEISLSDRALLEVATSIKLCDVVLDLSDNPKILNLTRCRKMRWQLEYHKLIPYLPTHMVMTINNILYNMTIPTKRQETDPEIDLLILLGRRREEREYAFYLLEQERKEKERYKRSYMEEKSKRLELERECERFKFQQLLRPGRGGFQHGYSEGFKLGRKIGKLEAESSQIIQQGKLTSSLMRHRLSKKQKEKEAFHAILLRRHINWRWWDLLPRGSDNPLPPVRIVMERQSANKRASNHLFYAINDP